MITVSGVAENIKQHALTAVLNIMPEDEMDNLKDNLRGRLRNYVFAVFKELAERDTSHSNYAKFVKLISQITTASGAAQMTVDTDIDYFKLSPTEREPYISALEKCLAAIDAGMTQTNVTAQLQASSWTEICGIPIEYDMEKLVFRWTLEHPKVQFFHSSGCRAFSANGRSMLPPRSKPPGSTLLKTITRRQPSDRGRGAATLRHDLSLPRTWRSDPSPASSGDGLRG